MDKYAADHVLRSFVVPQHPSEEYPESAQLGHFSKEIGVDGELEMEVLDDLLRSEPKAFAEVVDVVDRAQQLLKVVSCDGLR